MVSVSESFQSRQRRSILLGWWWW